MVVLAGIGFRAKRVKKPSLVLDDVLNEIKTISPAFKVCPKVPKLQKRNTMLSQFFIL